MIYEDNISILNTLEEEEKKKEIKKIYFHFGIKLLFELSTRSF